MFLQSIEKLEATSSGLLICDMGLREKNNCIRQFAVRLSP